MKTGQKNSIEETKLSYRSLLSLNEKEYPKYLELIFKKETGTDLDLDNPITFNQKIQWLKLYDLTPLKTKLTDKVLVRDWVKNQIGDEYLKPVLWIGSKFDDIPFEKLPEKFIIKANNGCKWQYKIKSKTKLLGNKDLFSYVKRRFDGWMVQKFHLFGGFELQYRDIIPQIIIEELLPVNDDSSSEFEIYCFNSEPMFYQEIKYSIPAVCCVYNKDYSISKIEFNPEYIKMEKPPDKFLKRAVELSKKLAEGFKLVRADWIKCENRLYFNEMTFTPFSGFFRFKDKNTDEYLGSLLKIKQNKENPPSDSKYPPPLLNVREGKNSGERIIPEKSVRS